MGYGDELIASGQARGAKARGKRIAFGNGERIIWHDRAFEVFDGNPNVALPGSEQARDLEWIANYVGHRPYNRQSKDRMRWEWIPGQVKRPGEIFFKPSELAFAQRYKDFVLIEPNVATFKSDLIPNKRWSQNRYQHLVHWLRRDGYRVVQLRYPPPYGPGVALTDVKMVDSPSFRHALALLARASLFVGGEGGMHHGAAAVGTPAVVIFGGFISPAITGYSFQVNHYAGGEPCGNLRPCQHCVAALHRISSASVYESCVKMLARGRDALNPTEISYANDQASV